jgi:hypothetical protein
MKTFWPVFLAILAAAFVIFCFAIVKSDMDESHRVDATIAALKTQTEEHVEEVRHLYEDRGMPLPPELARTTPTPKPSIADCFHRLALHFSKRKDEKK